MKSNRSTACWPTFTWNYHNRNQSGLLLAHCGLCTTPLLLLLLIIRVHHVLCITEILIIFIVVYKTHSLPRGYYITFQQSTRSSSEELLQSELALFLACCCCWLHAGQQQRHQGMSMRNPATPPNRLRGWTCCSLIGPLCGGRGTRSGLFIITTILVISRYF